MVIYSLPVQWVGLLLLVWFAGWLPTSGMSDPYLFDAGFLETFVDRARHMILPATCVALMLFGSFALVVRSSQLEALGDDHVLTARAKGYRNRRVVWREAFRSAMLPLVTLSTLTLGWVIAGTILVESVFTWPGVGQATVRPSRRATTPCCRASSCSSPSRSWASTSSAMCCTPCSTPRVAE